MRYLKDFENATALMVDMFCKKQELELDHIIGDDITGMYCFYYYFFSLDDIYLDIKSECPKGQILEWHESVSDASFKGLSFINYKSWCMGARYKTEKA